MPDVWIPPLLRDLTCGQERITVPGETIRQVVGELDTRYAGIKDRLCEGDRLRPNIAVAVDGEVSPKGLRQKVSPESEVHFIPAMSGGQRSMTQSRSIV